MSSEFHHLTTESREVPRHVAIIMDGNNRWAKRRGKSASFGHKAGVEAVRGVLKLCRDHRIEVLTLFAFSSENWQRPKAEVKGLMTLLSMYLKNEVKKLHKDGVRVRIIGGRDRFSKNLLKQIEKAEDLTRANTATTLVIAIDYGGQWDITNAARTLAHRVKKGDLQPEQIDVDLMDSMISLADLPSPDLCIRTAGEHRISNFMLWQLAYSEFFFTNTLWPDFSDADMVEALASYAHRERRYGGRGSESDTVELSDAAGKVD